MLKHILVLSDDLRFLRESVGKCINMRFIVFCLPGVLSLNLQKQWDGKTESSDTVTFTPYGG